MRDRVRAAHGGGTRMKNKYNLSLADMVSYGYLWD